MKIEQIYTGCLAEAAYYIESNGEAAIVDPLRETAPYIKMAEERGATIKYVLETHFHADFVSGHLDLAKNTGAKIVYGPTAQPNFDAHVAEDGELLSLGNIKIKVLHTPGHTMESSTFLVLDENDQPHSIYTGDTLFIGDVGRPDLAVKTNLTQEDLASHLFDSLRNKIMPLPDHVIVYPGHGQGSACGKNMSSETSDNLGNQKRTNYALRADMGREEFIKEVITGLVAPPQYFPKNAVMNKMGYNSFDNVLEQGMQFLSVDEFKAQLSNENTVIIDTRHHSKFTEGFIPKSIFIGIDDNFAPWMGVLIEDLNAPILMIADEGREEEVITRMARVGYDNPVGFLKGGIAAWTAAGNALDSINNMTPETFVAAYPVKEMNVLDVRKKSEYDSQHVEGVENFPLDFIYNNLSKLDKEKAYTVHCAGGYRSVAAASILKKFGVKTVSNVLGGFNAMKKVDGLPISAYQEQTTML
jgi:glyoxylase-like metal-dependent hydrolase (beta-lactamase superfamily II)/rhodanese-related sulfurtransferase